MPFQNIYHQYLQKKEKETTFIKESITSLDFSLSEVAQLLAQNEYLYQFNIAKTKVQLDQLSRDTKRKMSNSITGFKKIIYGLSAIQKQYEEKQEEFDARINSFFESVRQQNKQFMHKAVADARKIIENVEGRPLDAQQMECIIKNPRNQLVIPSRLTTVLCLLLSYHIWKRISILNIST